MQKGSIVRVNVGRRRGQNGTVIRNDMTNTDYCNLVKFHHEFGKSLLYADDELDLIVSGEKRIQ